MIHETAIIDSGARIDPSAEIGPYVVIGSDVQIGAGTVVGPHVVIDQNTIIGENNTIHQGAAIGGPPQDLSFKGQKTWVRIGNGNTIREFVTIHRATKEEGATTIGDNNYIMAYAHFGHDVQVGNHCILCNNIGLAGHVTIGDRAVISALVGVHQFSRIGSMVMIGGLARINQDVLPYTLIEGNPASTHGLNVVGLRRNGVDAAARRELKAAYKILCRSGLSTEKALVRIAAEVKSVDEVRRLVDFVNGTKRGFIK